MINNFGFETFIFLLSVDWIVINMLAVRQGMVGHIRYVLKDSLKYLPMYGFYFRQVSTHFLADFVLFLSWLETFDKDL